jgi:anti-sigma-K factor RskA
MNTTAAIPREPPEGSLAAAEYVLGVLDQASRRMALARIAREPAFARDVALWEARFAPLLDEIAPVPPPFALWPRIRAAAGIAGPAPQTKNSAPSRWQSLRLWRWLAAGGFALAAASLAALFLATSQLAPPRAVPMVATLATSSGTPAFVASIDASGTLVVLPITVDVPPDRVAELWLIPPGDVPHSLGLLDAQHARRMSVPPNLRAAFAARVVVAVSLEPPGGAPHGKPTGPVIATGQIALL